MKRNLQRTAINKKAVIEQLKDTKGIISIACQRVGITRQTFWMWLKDDPDFKQEVDEITEYQIDYVESRLLDKIEDGSDTAIIFYLKCKGKHRGYVEKTELDINSSSSSIKVEFGSKDDNDETPPQILNG